MLGSIPLLTSTLVGVIWSIRSGDVQAAFTVAAFILALGTGEFNFFSDRVVYEGE